MREVGKGGWGDLEWLRQTGFPSNNSSYRSAILPRGANCSTSAIQFVLTSRTSRCE